MTPRTTTYPAYGARRTGVRCGSHHGHGVAQLVQINQTDRAPAPADWLDTNRANAAGRGTRKRLERHGSCRGLWAVDPPSSGCPEVA
jgi:hypothetical protein